MKRKRTGGVAGSVMKAMSVFSGVQVFSILCAIVRTKLVALWIGAAGVGLFGIFNQALDMINTFTQLSMRNSAVRDIAAAPPGRIARVVCVVRRWGWMLGIFGAIVTVILSPLLSRLTFGNGDHTMGFILLSIAVFLSSVSNSELAVLQGLKKLSYLARCTIWGVTLGLVISIPLFYFFGERSIVPSILAYVIATSGAAWYYRDRDTAGRNAPKVTRQEIIQEGKGFIQLGIYLTITSFITIVAGYSLLAYLNHVGGTAEVGFFQAGYTIVNSYVGLVFSAIAMEYYPRLCAVNGHGRRTSLFVSYEMLIAMLVILPVATVFMSVDDVIVALLYDHSFEATTGYLSWALGGTVFRAISWCMAFVILARGDGRTYLVTEITSAACYLLLSIPAYHIAGLPGMGFAYMVWYLIYAVIVGTVYFRRYGLRISRNVSGLTIVTALLTIGCAALRFEGMRIPVIVVAVCACVFSLLTLKRLLLR